MGKIQNLEDLYSCKLSLMPDNLKKEIGHFNVFSQSDLIPIDSSVDSYSRKSFYKIGLILDHHAEGASYSLFFANTQVPYSCNQIRGDATGFFCIFTEAFFSQYVDIKKYPIFGSHENPILTIDKGQAEYVQSVFLRMIEEQNSDYYYKYDVLRNLVLELVHAAMKMQPVTIQLQGQSNAADRISSFFIEILESQFPITNPSQQITLRTPAEFADHLAVHVNHLNRALKETTGKTTSQLIAERLMHEAKMLLRNTNWNINEVGWCLGFEELSHFIHFFKKHIELTPKSFRELQPV
jgi:AraC family transcriptional activator of pobA